MKIKKISPCLIAMSGLSMALAGCQSEEQLAGNMEGRSLPVEVTVTVPTEETRTSLTELNGNLVWEWQEGDQLLVTTASGANVGTLTVKDIKENNPASATFTGNINGLAAGKQSLTFHYLGKGQSPAAHRNNYAMSIAEQSGNKNDLVKYDVLSTTLDVDVNTNYINIPDFSMSHYFAAGHFALHFSDDRTLSGETVTISGDNLYNKADIDLGKTGFTSTAGDIVVTNGTGDFYINLIPGNDVQMNFSVVTEDGIEWTGSLPNRFNIEDTRFYRSGATLGGLVIEMKNNMVPEDPSNPGNMGHWGGPDCEVKYVDSGDLSKKFSDGGYVYNNYSQSFIAEGGWATPITYTSNGVTHGALHTSNKKMNGETINTTASYYQWGRWMGFPENVYNILRLTWNGQAENNWPYSNEYFVPGESIRNTSCGYINTQDGAVPGGFFAQKYTTVYTSDGWDNSMAKKASHIYGAVRNINSDSFTDYLNTNENCNWTDRTGNPCPKGWRIPTSAELSVLIPSGGSINGKVAGIKEIDGVKYAMRWEVTSTTVGGNSYPCVRISSVRTMKSSVTFDDAVFKNAKSLDILAYGVLSNTGQISYKGQRAYVWSQNSTTSTSLSGFGGAALRVIFSGSTATMSMVGFDRVYGATVIPIQDVDATPTSITPWFPLTNF